MKRITLCKAILFGVLFTLCCVGSGFAADADNPWVALQPECNNALVTDASVTVDTVPVAAWATDAPNDYYITLSPTGVTPDTGLIIYPGAYVPVEAYAPVAREIASRGYLVCLVTVPGYFSGGTGYDRAQTVITAYPGISTWAIGGHSMGGVSACGFSEGTYGSAIDGIVLWASYPAGDISGIGKKVVSIYGLNDTIADDTDIANSVANLPVDTTWAPLVGANHSQFGWYGSHASDHSYVQPVPVDSPADITRDQQTYRIAMYTVYFLDALSPSATNIPATLETVTANVDGSEWERVNFEGFDNPAGSASNNFSVVAMTEYQNRLYAMTRNQAEGAEVWRTTGTGWEQVLFPGGVENGVYGNPWLNNVWGRMIVFDGKLYFGISSGLQGSYLGSTGCEIWRFDGTEWEPVISSKFDTEESGSITAISDCADADSAKTSRITDSTKTWVPDEWAGGVLEITSGDGLYRKFKIISNTADTLTIQQNDSAGTGADPASESEFTICAAKNYSNPYPMYSYTLGAIVVGDSYEIGTGYDESGFGEPWNKTITDMDIFDGKLYVSTGLNYEFGAQVWYTADGDNWTVTLPANSFGNYHTDGTAYPDGLKPISSSITNLTVFDGKLYAGGTGTSGDKGSCSRMAVLTPTGWELIVDVDVDGNDTGTNENGFGDGMGCTMSSGNFMPWNLATFDSKLIVGINSLGGIRVLYSNEAGSADTDTGGGDMWKHSVGGTSAIPEGFDGLANFANWGYNNIAINMFPYASDLMYTGDVTIYIPEYGATPPPGCSLRSTPDGIIWNTITDDGFGDGDIVIFEGFADFGGTVYVSGSKGASSTPQGLGGAKIFRLVTESVCGDGTLDPGEECEVGIDCTGTGESCEGCQCVYTPECGNGIVDAGEECGEPGLGDCAPGYECKNCICSEVVLIELAGFSAKGAWNKVTLEWSTDAEIDNAGFNIYRADAANGDYVKINASIIPAKGSATEGASYSFIDRDVKIGGTYFYKLKDIDLNGTATEHGPVSTRAIGFGLF